MGVEQRQLLLLRRARDDAPQCLLHCCQRFEGPAATAARHYNRIKHRPHGAPSQINDRPDAGIARHLPRGVGLLGNPGRRLVAVADGGDERFEGRATKLCGCLHDEQVS